MKKIFMFLILFIISTFIFTSTVSANNLKYEYQLIGYVNNISDSRITSITNLKLDVYSYNNNNIISNTTYEDTIYPESNGKIYYNIDNNKNYFFKVDITTLPIGYGIENEDYYFDNDNLAIISLITIDHVICTDNNYEYYSSSNNKLISQYNSSLNSITTYNTTVAEEDNFSLASSEEENRTFSFDNTDYALYQPEDEDECIVGNASRQVQVNFYYFDEVHNVNAFYDCFDAFRTSYINAYNLFCSKFNVTPYTRINGSNYEIDTYFKLQSNDNNTSGNNGGSYEYIDYITTYYFTEDIDYNNDNDEFNFVISHELGHAFIFELFLCHYESESLRQSYGDLSLNEGMSEFLSIFYTYIDENGLGSTTINSSIESRLKNEFLQFYKIDRYNNSNLDGRNFLCTRASSQIDKNPRSLYVLFLFLYHKFYDYNELDDSMFFNVIKNICYSIHNSIGAYYYCINDYLSNILNLNIDNFNYELNEFISFFDESNSILTDFLEGFDDIITLNLNNNDIFNDFYIVQNSSCLSRTINIYSATNANYVHIKSSERYFYLHNHTETTFNQSTKYNLTLTYSNTMAVQAVYKTVDNEIFSSVVEYVPTANNTTSNIVINVPAQTECFLYVYYKTGSVNVVSTVTFTSITSTMDVIDINNNELLSYGDTYNDFGVLRLLIENGNYNNTFVSNYNFTIKLLDYYNEEVYTYNPSVSNNKYIYNLSNIPYNGTYFILLIPTTVNQLIYTNIYSTSITSSITFNGSKALLDGDYLDNVVTSFTNLNTNMYKIMFNYPYNVNYCYNVTNSSNNIVYKYNDSIPGTTANYTYNDGIICMLGNTTYNINVTNTYSNSLNNYYMKLIMIDESSTLQSDQAMGKSFGNGVHEDVIKIEVEDSGTYRLICSYTGSITNDADVYLMVKDNNNVVGILGFSLNDLNKTVYYDYYLPNNYDYYIVIDKELTNFDFYMEGVMRNA